MRKFVSSPCAGWRAWAVIFGAVAASHAPELCLALRSNPIGFTAWLSLRAPESLLPGRPGFNDPNTGWTAQALGRLAADTWLHGEVPWRNPYSGVGLPLAAVMQGSALFLPFVLLLALPDGLLYLKMVLQFVAGCFTFALLLQLRISRPVSLLGAVLFALNGTFAWMGDAPIMPVAFLPMLLFGIERAHACAGEVRSRGWAWISIGLAWSVLAGFPETAFIDGLLGLVWALFRLVSAERRAAARFAIKLGVGGCAGLLLAMPALLPFLELLPVSDWGVHGVFRPTLLPANFAMFLFPSAFGPIEASGDWFLWGSAGGYMGLPVALLATLGLRRNAKLSGLRTLLACWIAVFLLEAANPPGLAWVFDLVSRRGTIWFSRYAPPSWELASILLAMFAIDDWRDRGAVAPSRATGHGLFWLLLGFITAVVAWPKIAQEIAAFATAPYVFAIGVAVSVALMSVIAFLLRYDFTRGRAGLLASCVAVSAILPIWLPQFAGARVDSTDLDALAFLKAGLGLRRFYTTGPLHPNYGAYFQLASINMQYLPAPRGWDSFIKARIDPAARDGSLENWPGGRFDADYETRKADFRARIEGLLETGTQYVVTERNSDPFLTLASLDTPSPYRPAAGIAPLLPTQSLSGSVGTSRLNAGQIDAASLRFGTYRQDLDGDLSIELCAQAQCVTGKLALANAVDDDANLVELPSLAVRPGEMLRYRITHAGGVGAVAVFLYPSKAPAIEPTMTPDGPRPGLSPELVLFSNAAKPIVSRVYSDKLLDIYQLDHPAPYFETSSGNCTMSPVGRARLRTACATRGHLIRRELFFPGWKAYVNGIATNITSADGIFQDIDLPAGTADIRFAYAPPYIGWAYACVIAGAAILLAGFRGARAGFVRSPEARART